MIRHTADQVAGDDFRADRIAVVNSESVVIAQRGQLHLTVQFDVCIRSKSVFVRQWIGVSIGLISHKRGSDTGAE